MAVSNRMEIWAKLEYLSRKNTVKQLKPLARLVVGEKCPPPGIKSFLKLPRGGYRRYRSSSSNIASGIKNILLQRSGKKAWLHRTVTWRVKNKCIAPERFRIFKVNCYTLKHLYTEIKLLYVYYKLKHMVWSPHNFHIFIYFKSSRQS